MTLKKRVTYRKGKARSINSILKSYWAWLIGNGIRVAQVNPYVVKKTKELGITTGRITIQFDL